MSHNLSGYYQCLTIILLLNSLKHILHSFLFPVLRKVGCMERQRTAPRSFIMDAKSLTTAKMWTLGSPP